MTACSYSRYGTIEQMMGISSPVRPVISGQHLHALHVLGVRPGPPGPAKGLSEGMAPPCRVTEIAVAIRGATVNQDS